LDVFRTPLIEVTRSRYKPACNFFLDFGDGRQSYASQCYASQSFARLSASRILCKNGIVLDRYCSISSLAERRHEAGKRDMLMNRSRSQLLLIDIQDKLVPHVADGKAAAANCARLAQYARRLDVPVTLTEHYPGGLGPTAEPVLSALGNDVIALPKIAFSSWQEPAIRTRIEALWAAGRTQVIVAGMEAHVCVGQTAFDLITAGLDVFLVADAVSSRSARVRNLSRPAPRARRRRHRRA
jgi:nicotinamidase-related amidase